MSVALNEVFFLTKYALRMWASTSLSLTNVKLETSNFKPETLNLKPETLNLKLETTKKLTKLAS